ncbi:MAG: flagellar hook capping protein [Verrucomicrobiota bacterium]|jgi:flagellar basal-body rod modification protein FlgD
MSDIAISGGGGSSTADIFTTASDRSPQKLLGQDDFLKLLVTQMTSQDPLKPDGDMEFIGQMASFASLEQTREMVTDLSSMRLDQEVLKANALIGRTVELDLGDDARREFGTVTSVFMEAGKPKVVVGGRAYDLSQLRTITSPGAPPPGITETR